MPSWAIDAAFLLALSLALAGWFALAYWVGPERDDEEGSG